MNPFKWLRDMARAAVVQGAALGVNDLLAGEEDAPVDWAALRERARASAQAALPAADEGEVVAGRKGKK